MTKLGSKLSLAIGAALVAFGTVASGQSMGDFAPGATIDCTFGTVRPSTGASHTLAGDPAVAVYKDNNTTESTTGVTLSVDHDSRTGFNQVRITTASDGTFYSAGGTFSVALTAGTVDGVSVAGQPVCAFTLAKTAALRPTVADRTLDVSTGGEAGVDWANIGSPSSTVSFSGTTIATATNLTNAPTSGDFTATMKTSIQTAAAAALTSYDPPTHTEVQTLIGQIAQMIGKRTTVSALSSQTEFTPTDTPTSDAQLPGWGVLLIDAGDADAYSLRKVISVSSGEITINAAPDFTLAASDVVVFLPAFLADPVQIDLEQLFAQDSGSTAAEAVEGSVVAEIGALAAGGGLTAEGIADEVETRFPANFADLAIAATTGRVDVGLIEGSDATNQIRDSVVDDTTRIDASALNTASTRVATALPNAAAGGNGGLPTVDSNNRIAGVQGTINTLDALDTAQDSQHSTTQGLVTTVDGVVDAILAIAQKLDTALEADDEVYRFTANALEQAPVAEGGLNLSDIADAVWEKALAECEGDTGSVCEALAAASAGGGGSGGLDADGIRAALGLDAADLDDQLEALAMALSGLEDLSSSDVQSAVAAALASYGAATAANVTAIDTALFRGTADSGDTNTLVDAALTSRFASNDLLNGRYVVRSDGQACFVADYVATSGTVEFGDCAFTGVWSTQTYVIYPAGTQ